MPFAPEVTNLNRTCKYRLLVKTQIPIISTYPLSSTFDLKLALGE